MAKALIIVESPTKIKTFKNLLGDDYMVDASVGHIRDLPEKKLGVDIENDFLPTYEVDKNKADLLRRLSAQAKQANIVYLASDNDREGEAIAWHLEETLKLHNARRIVYNELSKQAIEHAIANPRSIDMDLVNAQQARRVLDRLVGYKLSPVLWKKIQKGLSAGRVQSVVLRLICDREREILAFVPEEYWSLTASLTPQPPKKRFPFDAKLHSRARKRLEPKTQSDIEAIVADLSGAAYTVADVKQKEQRRNPAPPFTTSTVQQEASRKLGFSNRRTMSVAQDLYEGIDLGEQGSVGLITYMRTDSVRVGEEPQGEARQFIGAKYGASYVPDTPRVYKTKSSAQDAHEAIRPTSAMREPDLVARYLNSDQMRLYRLIWQRFVASQMNSAIMDVTTADIEAVGETMRASGGEKAIPYTFRSTGSVMKFDGFMRVYTEGKDTEEVSDDEQPPLPPLTRNQQLDLIKLDPRQHFTEPPPRYTEATIVKKMEEVDIGRPSTWASFIQVIRERKYVELREKRFYPTELGFTVSDQLVKHFPSIMDVQFTAEMDHKLDDVAQGSVDWITLLRGFYGPFELQVEAAKTEMENLKPQPVVTEICCPDTGKPMLLRQGRYGPFLGCSGFPECKKILKLAADGSPLDGLNFTCGLLPQGAKEPIDPASLPNATDHVCPEGKGVMLVRAGRFGPFLGCSSYPKCRSTLKITTGGELLPDQEFVCTFKEAAKGSGRKPSVARTGVRKSTAAASKSSPGKKAGAASRAAPKRKPAVAKTTTKE